MTERLTADKARERSTVIETIEIEGTEYEIEVKDITLGELNTFEKRERGGEPEKDIMDDIFEEYLVEPDLDSTDDVPRRKLEAIIDGMYRAWGATDEDIQVAMEEMQTPGNRQ